MKFEDAVKKLEELLSKQIAYGHAMSILYLDGSTNAPKNSVEGRGKTLSFLSGEVYKTLINDETDELLNFLLSNKDKLDKIKLRIVEQAREEFDKTSKIPMNEFMEFAELQNKSSQVWEEAKHNDDFALFEPYLTKIVEFKKRFAKYRDPDKKAYNVMLDDYEKGYTMDDYDKFFAILKEKLVPLIHDVVPKNKDVRDDFLYVSYPIDKQKILSTKILDILLLDKNNYNLAETEHPFTMGINKNDVRFTTHFFENDLTSAIYSTIHEAGHATYELNTADELMYTTLDTGASLGIHESQSRFYENIIGRSKEFTKCIYPIIKDIFPDQFSDVSYDVFYAAINKPKASLIRVEADELTYSLHIMVRYEIERMLFSDEIKVKDLPEVWNKMYKEYLGITPKNNAEGVLQDVHWSDGLFGYFPTYALGSAISSQLAYHMEKEFDYKADVEKGDLSKVNAWLTDKIHKHGDIMDPKKIINYACNEDFDAKYYCDYLIKKYSI